MTQKNVDSVNVFEQISQICRDFRKQISQGKPPRIEKYLSAISEDGRENLFSNLLEIELRFRQSKGQNPTSEEYLKRFSQYAKQVRRAFFEPTMASIDSGDSGDDGTRSLKDAFDASEHTLTFQIPDANRLGDYELIRELGRGGMGVVYEARHTKTNNRVALKTLPTGGRGQEVNADKLYRFRKEFRRLSEINHPNLVGMQTLEVDGSQWFFTMDVIDGIGFLSFVRPNNQLDESRLRSCLNQLANGVMALHRRNIIHRDLKPSNVLVSANGTVSILDFGLAAEMQLATDMTQTKSGMFAGTPRYAAPEQMFGQRTEASDWYALGTMIYESLTGEPPFNAGTQMDLLRQKQNEEAPCLSGRDDLPADLAELADGLIRREPASRLNAEAIGQILQLDQETRTARSTRGSKGSQGSHDSSGSVDADGVELEEFEEEEIVLIGREEQLAQLEAIKNDFLKTRKPHVVWVTGLSGEGKSSLCEKFLRPLRKGTEMLVLSGRCYDRESVPFKAIDSIIDPLVSFLRSHPGKRVAEDLPEDMEYLARLFPLLNRADVIEMLPPPPKDQLDPEKVRARGFYALRMLLNRITEDFPVVFLIDDLQWADAGSGQALVEILTQSPVPAVLFLGSYRRDEVDDSPFLKQWKQMTASELRQLPERHVKVNPLTPRQCLELAARRIDINFTVLEQQTPQLFSNSTGNPYLLEQLLTGYNPETGEFQALPLNQIVANRLRNLPETAGKLLEVLAVSGQPLAADELIRAAELLPSELGVLTAMRSERLVRLLGDPNRLFVDTYHDKIRETILTQLDEATTRLRHLQLAETIEAAVGCSTDQLWEQLKRSSTPADYTIEISSRVFDLANHFAKAFDRRSSVYQFLAAEKALQAQVAIEAVGRYRDAEQMLPSDAAPQLRYRLQLGLAKSLAWSRRVDDALQAYQQANDAAENAFDRARSWCGMVEANTQVARFDQAIECYDEALKQLGKHRPKSLFGNLAAFLVNAFRVIAIPAGWQKAGDDQAKRYAQLETELNSVMTRILFEKNTIAGFERAMKGSVAGFRTGNPGFVNLGHAQASSYLSVLGANFIGKICLRRVEANRGFSSENAERGLLLFAKADGNYFCGNLSSAISVYEEAKPELLRFGNFYWLFFTLHMLRHSQAFVGAASEELSSARELLEQAEEVGNTQHICFGNYDVASAHARAGQLIESVQFMKRAYTSLQGESYRMAEAIRASTDSYVRLQCSDYKAARELALSAWRMSIAHFCLIDVTLLCLPLAIEGIAGPNWRERLERSESKILKKMVRQAKCLYLTIPNHQPHLQRAFGRASASLGKLQKAIRRFKKAVRISQKKGMKYQKAKSLLDLAAVKEEGREENRAEAIRLLQEMESVIPRAESWLLGDQYDESVVAPEFDLEAWEAEHGPIAKLQGDSE